MATYFPDSVDPVAADVAAMTDGMADGTIEHPLGRHWSRVESQQMGAEVDRVAREQEQRGVR